MSLRPHSECVGFEPRSVWLQCLFRPTHWTWKTHEESVAFSQITPLAWKAHPFLPCEDHGWPLCILSGPGSANRGQEKLAFEGAEHHFHPGFCLSPRGMGSSLLHKSKPHCRVFITLLHKTPICSPDLRVQARATTCEDGGDLPKEASWPWRPGQTPSLSDTRTEFPYEQPVTPKAANLQVILHKSREIFPVLSLACNWKYLKA